VLQGQQQTPHRQGIELFRLAFQDGRQVVSTAAIAKGHGQFRHRQDAACHGQPVAGAALGIAAAVQSFVVFQHGPADFGVILRKFPEQQVGDHRVGTHLPLLGRLKGATQGEDLWADVQFPEVMEQPRRADGP